MAVHLNSLANLRPARRGDVRNPAGVNGYTKDNTLADRYAATCQSLLTCEDEEQRAALMEGIDLSKAQRLSRWNPGKPGVHTDRVS